MRSARWPWPKAWSKPCRRPTERATPGCGLATPGPRAGWVNPMGLDVCHITVINLPFLTRKMVLMLYLSAAL